MREALSAVALSRTPLLYSDGPDVLFDRPLHVRAASSLALSNKMLYIAQDDANFVATYDLESKRVGAINLPAFGGKRLFDDARGTKKEKLDLEASVLDTKKHSLFLFGSGSSHKRETIVKVDLREQSVHCFLASALYEQLRAEKRFAGTDLNIEAAVLLWDDAEGVLRLFNRSNGQRVPCDASCDLSYKVFLEYLASPSQTHPPPLFNIRSYTLGALSSVPLSFTDVCPVGNKLFFCAAAEDTQSAQTDGAVAGSAVGVVGADGVCLWTFVRDAASSQPLPVKIEGLVVDESASYAYAVVDSDSHEQPSELLILALQGFN